MIAAEATSLSRLSKERGARAAGGKTFDSGFGDSYEKKDGEGMEWVRKKKQDWETTLVEKYLDWESMIQENDRWLSLYWESIGGIGNDATKSEFVITKALKTSSAKRRGRGRVDVRNVFGANGNDDTDQNDDTDGNSYSRGYYTNYFSSYCRMSSDSQNSNTLKLSESIAWRMAHSPVSNGDGEVGALGGQPNGTALLPSEVAKKGGRVAEVAAANGGSPLVRTNSAAARAAVAVRNLQAIADELDNEFESEKLAKSRQDEHVANNNDNGDDGNHSSSDECSSRDVMNGTSTRPHQSHYYSANGDIATVTSDSVARSNDNSPSDAKIPSSTVCTTEDESSERDDHSISVAAVIDTTVKPTDYTEPQDLALSETTNASVPQLANESKPLGNSVTSPLRTSKSTTTALRYNHPPPLPSTVSNKPNTLNRTSLEFADQLPSTPPSQNPHVLKPMSLQQQRLAITPVPTLRDLLLNKHRPPQSQSQSQSQSPARGYSKKPQSRHSTTGSPSDSRSTNPLIDDDDQQIRPVSLAIGDDIDVESMLEKTNTVREKVDRIRSAIGNSASAELADEVVPESGRGDDTLSPRSAVEADVLALRRDLSDIESMLTVSSVSASSKYDASIKEEKSKCDPETDVDAIYTDATTGRFSSDTSEHLVDSAGLGLNNRAASSEVRGSNDDVRDADKKYGCISLSQSGEPKITKPGVTRRPISQRSATASSSASSISTNSSVRHHLGNGRGGVAAAVAAAAANRKVSSSASSMSSGRVRSNTIRNDDESSQNAAAYPQHHHQAAHHHRMNKQQQQRNNQRQQHRVVSNSHVVMPTDPGHVAATRKKFEPVFGAGSSKHHGKMQQTPPPFIAPVSPMKPGYSSLNASRVLTNSHRPAAKTASGASSSSRVHNAGAGASGEDGRQIKRVPSKQTKQQATTKRVVKKNASANNSVSSLSSSSSISRGTAASIAKKKVIGSAKNNSSNESLFKSVARPIARDASGARAHLADTPQFPPPARTVVRKPSAASGLKSHQSQPNTHTADSNSIHSNEGERRRSSAFRDAIKKRNSDSNSIESQNESGSKTGSTESTWGGLSSVISMLTPSNWRSQDANNKISQLATPTNKPKGKSNVALNVHDNKSVVSPYDISSPQAPYRPQPEHSGGKSNQLVMPKYQDMAVPLRRTSSSGTWDSQVSEGRQQGRDVDSNESLSNDGLARQSSMYTGKIRSVSGASSIRSSFFSSPESSAAGSIASISRKRTLEMYSTPEMKGRRASSLGRMSSVSSSIRSLSSASSSIRHKRVSELQQEEYTSIIPAGSNSPPEIESDYSDEYSDDEFTPAPKRKKNDFKIPKWATTPELMKGLKMQEKVNPDRIFGRVKPLKVEEIFGRQHSNTEKENGKRKPRNSSMIWSNGDALTAEEELEYIRRMGFDN